MQKNVKSAKNQANAKQHPAAKLLFFENYSLSSSKLWSKNSGRRNSKQYTKIKSVCFNEAIWLMTMKMRLKIRNRSHIYNINGPRAKQGHKYTKYKI